MKTGARSILPLLLLCCLVMGPVKTVRGDSDVLNNLIEKGDFQAALAVVNAGLKGRPTDRSLLLHKGFLLVSLGRLVEAEGHYRDMKATLPDMPEPGNNLAVVYRNQGSMHAALLELAEVIEGFPLFEQAHDNLREICQVKSADAYAMEPEARDFCDAFDHGAADRARKAARDALPLVVEKNNVVEVIALRPVEFTSAPLDDDGPSGIEVVDADEANESLQRELADLAAEFESFRGRMEKELDAAVAAKTVAENDVVRIQAENVELEQKLAMAMEEVTTLEQRLAQSEKQRKDHDLSKNDAEAAISAMEAAVLQAEEERRSAEQAVVDLKSALAASEEDSERFESMQSELQAEVSEAAEALTRAQAQLKAERDARAKAERQANELESLLAALQDQNTAPEAGPEVIVQDETMPSGEVMGEQSSDEADEGSAGEENLAANPIEVAGAAEGQISDSSIAKEGDDQDADTPVDREQRIRQWNRRLEDQQLQGGYMKPPDHIQWQVEHVVTRWFETFESGDVDSHLALYSPTFRGFSGPRLTEWMGHRFGEQSNTETLQYDPMLMRMRQTAADSVEVFLPDFNSLPGATGGLVWSLKLRYRHGRWQIFTESSDHDRKTSS